MKMFRRGLKLSFYNSVWLHLCFSQHSL